VYTRRSGRRFGRWGGVLPLGLGPFVARRVGFGACIWELRRVRIRAAAVDNSSYFCNYRNMKNATKKNLEQVAKFADMFSAMGTEARLRIMQLLLSAHPEGMVVGELQEELDIPNSTLSHHLDKLRNEGLVQVRRESTFLRYTANTEALQEVLRFLYAECCTRNKAVEPRDVVQICK
jgi:ArsR family transcriptional regulator, arsenate/arsenite/antimonite-responsive transcriptional repressor